MERSKRPVVAGIVLVVLHVVGVIGFSLESFKPLFQQLTPLNLIITVVLLGVFHQVWTKRFAAWAFLTFMAGFLVEVTGVKTGLIFGEYAYLPAFGPQLWETPPIIGLNWLMLVYIIGMLVALIPVKRKGLAIDAPLVKSAIAATLLTLFDVLVEPVAIQNEFWTWFGQTPPLQNFAAWWLIGFVLFYGYYRLPQKPRNPLTIWVIGVQLLFFGGLFIIGNSS
ncbi:MAG: carotenoid biosynthesis protein [Bacteroidia bacterium]